MSVWTTTVERLRKGGLCCKAWGICGKKAAADLENAFNIKLANDIATFVEELGNLRIVPFDICIAGDSTGAVGAIPATRSLQNTLGFFLPADCVQIMDHAGEVYILTVATGAVAAFEARRPIQGHETAKWACFREFFEWIVSEAQRFQSGSDSGF
jgi:hypothetical protein